MDVQKTNRSGSVLNEKNTAGGIPTADFKLDCRATVTEAAEHSTKAAT